MSVLRALLWLMVLYVFCGPVIAFAGVALCAMAAMASVFDRMRG